MLIDDVKNACDQWLFRLVGETSFSSETIGASKAIDRMNANM